MRETITQINEETGEVKIFEERCHGDRTITMEQSNAYEKIKKGRSENTFVFAIFERCEPYMKEKELEPKDITRIIMLATYVNYDGKIMSTERSYMTKKEMKVILRESSESRFNLFYNKLLKYEIIEFRDEIYYMSDAYFNKGYTSVKLTKSRLFSNEIRLLFNGCKVSDFKKIGYVFKLLPYISHEHNIICTNPNEALIDYVIPMKVKDIAKVLDADKRNIANTIKSLSKIKIGDEFLIGWFMAGDVDNIKLFVNPRIIYSGKMNSDGIKLLKKLFS